MTGLWSRKELIAFVERNNDIIAHEMSAHEMSAHEIRERYRQLVAWHQAAVAELAQGVRVEKWKIPASAGGMPPATLFHIAAVMAYGSQFGVHPTPGQVNFLCHADGGGQEMCPLPRYVLPNWDGAPLLDYLLADARQREDTSAMPPAPSVLQVDIEAVRLAHAFYRQMLADSPRRPPAVLGECRMTKTGVELIDDLGLAEIRLVVTAGGMWLSLIFPDGRFDPGWWCPGGDTFILDFGQRFAWIFRTFCACLWRDLHTDVVKAKRVRDDRPRRRAGRQRPGEKVIKLPRTVFDLQWEDDVAHDWGRARTRKDYNVRAHYRHLHDGWQAAEDADERAAQHGFPPPPEGYTFVSAYVVGEGGGAIPRIVARGLRAAQVALARL